MFEIFADKYKNNAEFVNNLVWRTLQVFGKQGASFLIYLIGTIFISRSDMGVYNYIMGLVGLLVMFVDLGISTSTSKYIAEYSVNNKERINTVVSNALLMVIAFAVVVSIITALLWGSMIDETVKNSVTLLFLVIPIIFLSPVTSVFDGAFRGLLRFKELSIIALSVGFLTVVVSIPLTMFYGLIGAIISQILLYLIFAIVLIVKYGTFDLTYSKKIASTVMLYAFNFGIASIGYYLFSRITVVFVGYFGYFDELATYELLNRGFIIAILPFTIVGQVLSPYITTLYTKGDVVAIRKKYFAILKYVFPVTFFLLALSILVLPILIEILFPSYYDDLLISIVVPVALTYSIMAISGPINAGFIVATGHAHLMTILNIVTGIITTVATYFVIKNYGFLAAIYLNLISQFVAFLILQYSYLRILKRGMPK